MSFWDFITKSAFATETRGRAAVLLEQGVNEGSDSGGFREHQENTYQKEKNQNRQ
jgi:hypothetical protein